MSEQSPLFHENFNDALLSAVKALGKVEVVARQLWPNKPNAGRYLSDCLNPDRDAKLALEDLIALLKMARETGAHWAIYQLCDECGYARPAIATPKTDAQRLAERRVLLAQQMLQVENEAAAIDRAEGMAQIRSVSDGRGGR